MQTASRTMGLLAAVAAVGLSARAGPPTDAAASAPLAHAISTLIRDAIPLEYEKQDDWGATKQIDVGLRATGNLRDFDVKRRRRNVNHGVWKHYKLKLIDPQQNLAVQLTRLESRAGGGVNFTLRIDAVLDAWARAKVYEYGVHLIALEAEGDARVTLVIDGEIALAVTAAGNSPAIAVQPQVHDARLALHEVHLRRISNARGPLVRQLGDDLAKLAADEINGPPLVARLNRAIDKKRDRLVYSASEVFQSDWGSLAGSLPPPPQTATAAMPPAAAP
jgi:hypothetical protein